MVMVPGGPSSIPLPDPVRVITDTDEMRWFLPGRLPVDVLTWFSRRGGRGAVEERTDTYRLDGAMDSGLKLRSGKVLELKVRQAIADEPLALGDRVGGRLESWRRWSPADGLVEFEPTDEWGDVTKTIVKRRFLGDGVELNVEPDLPRTGFCDMELAALGFGGARWWSLALAAYGPTEARRDLVRRTWEVVTSVAPFPKAFIAALDEPRGYPAWLATAALQAEASPMSSGVLAG